MSNNETSKNVPGSAASHHEIESFIKNAASGDYKAVKSFLEKHKEDVNRRNEEGWYAITWSAHFGHWAVVEILLDNGANCDLIDRDLMTPLLYAARRGCTDTARLLIDKGANINHKNKAGWTALMLAVKNDRIDMVRLLLEKKNLLLDEKNEDGDTALMLAAWNKHACIAGMLVKAGASLGITDSAGKTALQLAEISDDPDTITLLKEAAKAP